jgi:hypothetical protein
LAVPKNISNMARNTNRFAGRRNRRGLNKSAAPPANTPCSRGTDHHLRCVPEPDHRIPADVRDASAKRFL